jgi:hypothetical protein
MDVKASMLVDLYGSSHATRSHPVRESVRHSTWDVHGGGVFRSSCLPPPDATKTVAASLEVKSNLT